MILLYLLLALSTPFSVLFCKDFLYAHGRSKSIVALHDAENKQKILYIDTISAKELHQTPTLKVNNTADQPNPLINKSLSEITFPADKAFFVTKEEPNVLYCLENSGPHRHVMAATPFADGQGDQSFLSAGIIKLETASTDHHYIFAALKPHNGNFGQKGGGIGLISYNASLIDEVVQDGDKEVTNKVLHTSLMPFDAQAGTKGANRAAILDTNTLAVAINGGVGSIQPNVVDMYWDHNLSCLYIALQIKTSSDASNNQGGRALVIGRVHNGTLIFSPIAPDTVFNGSINIVGATGANQYVSLHKVRTMQTSTYCNYVIIVGGNGKPEETKKMVYALPVVKKSLNGDPVKAGATDPFQGVLAKKNSLPEMCLVQNNRHGGLTLTQVAQTPEDVSTALDKEAIVGGAIELPGNIEDILVLHDAVFVLVQTEKQSIIFHSQAIISHTGHIAAWTGWKHFYTTSDRILSVCNKNNKINALINTATGDVILKAIPAFFSFSSINDTANTLITLLNNEFSHTDGGIQEIFPCSYQSSNTIKRTALLVTGSKKIAFVQTGHIEQVNNQLVMTLLESWIDQHAVKTEDGTLDVQKPYNIFITQGGDLDKLGPLSCANLVTDGKEIWLLVGGVSGIAVLSSDDGRGLPIVHDEEVQGLPLCTKSMSFKKISSQSFIQKIVCDSSFVYILSRNSLDRLSICRESFIQPEKASMLKLASTSQENPLGIFSDVIISGKNIIIATKNALFKLSKKSNLKTAIKPSDIIWQEVSIPLDKHLRLKQLLIIPSSLDKEHFFEDAQLYILAVSPSQSASAVYRFYIHKDFLFPVPDFFLAQEPTAFLNYSSFRDIIATNGFALIATQNSRDGEKPLITEDFFNPLWFRRRYSIRPTINTINNPYATRITTVAQDLCSGAWFIAGDFGVSINH